MSIAIFRALPTAHPRLMKLEESRPPTPPTPAINHDQRQRDRGQIELVHVAEEVRRPEQIEPPDRVGHIMIANADARRCGDQTDPGVFLVARPDRSG